MCLQSQNFMHSDTRDFKSELQESVKLIEMDCFIQYLKLYISNSTLEIWMNKNVLKKDVMCQPSKYFQDMILI